MSALSACVECRRPRDRYGFIRKRCKTCYMRHYRHGTHLELPRARTRVDVAEEYLHLRSFGSTRAQIAGQLGMTPGALNVALKRAALDGDTRSTTSHGGPHEPPHPPHQHPCP